MPYNPPCWQKSAPTLAIPHPGIGVFTLGQANLNRLSQSPALSGTPDTHTHTHTHTHAADSQVSRLPPAIFLLQHSPLPLPGSALSKLRSGTFSRASTACSHPSLIDTPLTIHLKILRVTGCPGAGWTPDPSATTFRCPCASDQRAVASHQHI